MSHALSHFLHYLFLVLILIAGFATFLVAPRYNIPRFWIIVSTVAAYVLWGIIHHWTEKRLNVTIIIEYVMIGILVVSLLTLVI